MSTESTPEPDQPSQSRHRTILRWVNLVAALACQSVHPAAHPDAVRRATAVPRSTSLSPR